MRLTPLALFALILALAGCGGGGTDGPAAGGGGTRELRQVHVTPDDTTIVKGTTIRFRATGEYSDNTTEDVTDGASWSSSNQGCADISASGNVTGMGAGECTIEAAVGGQRGSTRLTVRCG